ncbi:hypothetical protein ZWY2020_027455 [Hordeum vulgare]|nr:hypothetical protein ZWY2020_027455 [Hordeum vulgare]
MSESSMEFLLDAVDTFPIGEGFTDNIEQPDPIPLLFLLENRVRVSAAAQSNGVSAVAQNVEGEVSSGAVRGLRRQRDASPTKSAQSTNRVNPEAPGRTKRPVVELPDGGGRRPGRAARQADGRAMAAEGEVVGP